VGLIGLGAIVLSIASYQYYDFIATQITEIAKKDIRSNALIEAQGLSNSLENRISAVSSNLQVLASSHSIATGELAQGQSLIDGAQASTRNLTEGYYWLDADGKIITYSDVESGIFPEYRGNSLAHRDYFIVPRDAHRPYTTALLESVDNITRIYVSYPILGSVSDIQSEEDVEQDFLGAVVAAINPNDLGTFMQSQLPPQFSSTLGLMDREANILFSMDEEAIGSNYFDESFQSALPEEIRGDFNAIITRSLAGNVGAEDVALGGQSGTVAYSPVTINGEHVWTAYVVSTHSLAGEVGTLVAQQRNFSIIIVSAIGAVAVLIASLIIAWNRRLQNAVNSKTAELRDAVDSLKEANIKLKEHDRMQQEFINVAAHELRTPIQPILGASEMISDDFSDSPDKGTMPIDRETAEMIFRNAKRLERLSSDILQVSRIEGNKLKLDKEVFDINEKVRNVVNDAVATITTDRRPKVDIRLRLNDAPIYVEADRAKIYEVIANLVNNAVKFTRAAKSDGAIQIQTNITPGAENGKDSSATIEITDNGTGIDPTIMPRLFTKFATKSEQGTGLGLYISKSIIEAHRGKIWARNNQNGKGATFGFSLPVVDNQRINTDLQARSDPSTGPSASVEPSARTVLPAKIMGSRGSSERDLDPDKFP
jgi:signal transduction histidine kinase